MSRVVSRQTPGGVCAVNRDDFVKAFGDVPKTESAATPSDFRAKIDQSIAILSNVKDDDWAKRMNQLITIRSIVIHSEPIVGREHMLPHINRLTDSLDTSVRDLRSQIVKEAAITCSLLFQRYGNDVHQIADRCLLSAFGLVSSSTKVMATSAITMIAILVEHIQTKQVFNTIISYATSKDKNQRRQLAILLEIIIEHWNEKLKKEFMARIRELIKAAICDADPETRAAGRKAFQTLDTKHPDEGEKLFKTVDAQKQKMLRSADAGGSSASVNSDRGSMPFRSKLSNGSAGGFRAPNISSKFLAQRSASAIDTKQVNRMTMSTVVRTPTTKAPVSRVGGMTASKVDTSPGGSRFTRPSVGTLGPRTTSNLRSRVGVPSSQPGSRNTSPPRRTSTSSAMEGIQRVKSNLGPGSFSSSISNEEAAKLQKAMNNAREALCGPSRTDDDDFLLPARPTPVKQKSALEMSRVEAVIRACASTSANEKKEGIKMLATIVSDASLSDIEVKNTSNTLNRLLSEATNVLVLESVCAFVETHHTRLADWLKLGLSKLFAKKAAEMIPHNKKHVSTTIECVLKTFDPALQLKSVCELTCDPIHLLQPKARIVLLEYLTDLLKRMDRGATVNAKEMRATILKIFSWMIDQRNGQMITPYGENVLCAFFALNAAAFATVFNELCADYRDWAHRILQSHGHNQKASDGVVASPTRTSSGEDACVRAIIQNTAAQIEDFVTTRTLEMSSPTESSPLSKGLGSTTRRPPNLMPLRPLTSELNAAASEGVVVVDGDSSLNLNESFDRLKLNSTTHLIDDTAEQSKYVAQKLAQISGGNAAEQHDGLHAIQTMLAEGSFTLWEQNFAKLLIAVFDVLSKSSNEQQQQQPPQPHQDANKKMALRVLTKMCTSQAARLFDSTEMAICKVLDAAVDSTDGTMNVTANDCLKTLATHLPLAKIVNISKLILNQEKVQEARAGLVLKMMTQLFENLQADELSPVVDELAPCAIQAYDSPSSTVRKSAVYCLVAMVNKLGMRQMEHHLQRLPVSKLNLIQVYVNRAMSSSSHSHV